MTTLWTSEGGSVGADEEEGGMLLRREGLGGEWLLTMKDLTSMHDVSLLVRETPAEGVGDGAFGGILGKVGGGGVVGDCGGGGAEVEWVRRRAHRVVLAAASPTLRGLLCNACVEAATAECRLEGADIIAAPELDHVLDWIYGGRTGVLGGGGRAGARKAGAEDLVALVRLARAADYLQIGDLYAATEAALRRRVDFENCISVWDAAEAMGMISLSEWCANFVRGNFDSVASTKDFVSLMDASRLAALLADDDLVVSSEEQVFESVGRWCAARSPEAAAAALPLLLPHVRFPKMEPAGLYQITTGGRTTRCIEEWLGGTVDATMGAGRAGAGGAEVGEGVALADNARVKQTLLALLREARRCFVGTQPLSDSALAAREATEDAVDHSMIRRGRMARLRPRLYSSAVAGADMHSIAELGRHDKYVMSVVRCGTDRNSGDAVVCSSSRDGSVHVWALGQRPRQLCVLSGDGEVGTPAHSDGVWHLSSGWGVMISCSRDHTVKIWDVGTWALLKTLVGHTKSCYFSLQHEGKLFTAGGDATIRVWDPQQDWRCTKVMVGHQGPVLSLIVVGGWLYSGGGMDDFSIKVWHLHTFKCVKTLKAHKGDVWRLLWWQGMLLSTSYDGTCRLWQISPADARAHSYTLGHADVQGAEDGSCGDPGPFFSDCVATLAGHRGMVMDAMAVRFDGRPALLTTATDNCFRIWEEPPPNVDSAKGESDEGRFKSTCAAGVEGGRQQQRQQEQHASTSLECNLVIHLDQNEAGFALATIDNRIIGGCADGKLRIYSC